MLTNFISFLVPVTNTLLYRWEDRLDHVLPSSPSIYLSSSWHSPRFSLWTEELAYLDCWSPTITSMHHRVFCTLVIIIDFADHHHVSSLCRERVILCLLCVDIRVSFCQRLPALCSEVRKHKLVSLKVLVLTHRQWVQAVLRIYLAIHHQIQGVSRLIHLFRVYPHCLWSKEKDWSWLPINSPTWPCHLCPLWHASRTW